MTQDTPPPQGEDPLGTVAEEAAKLIAAFGAASAAGAPTATGSRPDRDEGSAGADRQTPAGAAGARPRAAGPCGHPAAASQPIACALCPVCQLIAVLHTVRPETVERLADLAAAAATALRDIASAAAAHGEDAPASPSEAPRSRAVPIDVVDEDEEAPR